MATKYFCDISGKEVGGSGYLHKINVTTRSGSKQPARTFEVSDQILREFYEWADSWGKDKPVQETVEESETEPEGDEETTTPETPPKPAAAPMKTN